MRRNDTVQYSSERTSKEYLEVNSCGIEYFLAADHGTDRPNGRSDYHILYAERGDCMIFIDGGWEKVPEGSVIIYRPHEMQKYYYPDAGSISHYVHFTGTGCESILKRLGLYDVRVFHMGKSSSYEKLSAQLSHEFAMKKPGYMDWCSAYIYQMLNVAARKYMFRRVSINRSGENRINLACKKIYENIKTPPSARELAAECFLSESRFSHLFKDAIGKSVSEFIMSIRIEKAKELLSLTSLSVREIACEVGYEDQNYFSRAFRRLAGCSPTEFRKLSLE